MTTPDGRDARSGEAIGGADPSIEAAGAGGGAPQQTPRTPGSNAPSVTEQAPRAAETHKAADEDDVPEEKR